MFVLRSTHRAQLFKLYDKHLAVVEELCELKRKWNELVQKINDKGGEAFLQGRSNDFTKEEIERLIRLCHPDRHPGSVVAVEMTQRLLEVRGRKNGG